MKKIRINADDFGMSIFINTAISELYTKSKIDSVSLMVAMKDVNALNHALQLIKMANIPTGLHVVLPIIKETPHISDNLKEISLKEMEISIACESLEFGMAVACVYDLIESQFLKFIDIVGKNPSHMDFHKNTNMSYAFVKEAVDLLIQKYGHIDVRTSENSCEFSKLKKENLTDKLEELYVHPSIKCGIFDDVHGNYQYNRYMEYIYLLNDDIEQSIKELSGMRHSSNPPQQ